MPDNPTTYQNEGYRIEFLPDTNGGCKITTNIDNATMLELLDRHRTDPDALTTAQYLFLVTFQPVIAAIATETAFTDPLSVNPTLDEAQTWAEQSTPSCGSMLL